MFMKFSCPHCSQHLQAESSMGGQQIACPACSQGLTIPTAVVSPTDPGLSRMTTARRKFSKLVLLLAGLLVLGSATGWFLFAKEGTKKTGNTTGELVEVKVFPTEVNLKTRQDR